MYRRRNFSFVARYSLKFTRCSLLVVKSLVARCKIHSLLVVEVARCKIRSLLVAGVARCKKSHVTRSKIRLLLVAEFASCKKSLVACCKNAPVALCRSCSFQKITGSRCKISLILIAKNHSLLIQSPARIIVCLKSTKLDESFSFFNIICFLVCCYQKIV